ncbi:MAG: hypothetical protein WBP26_00030 [Candidatus Saccharimonadales bacterium]
MQRYSRQPNLLQMARKLAKLQVSGGPDRPDPVLRTPRRVDARLSDEDRAAIAQAYRDGIPSTALCRQYNLGKSTVLQILAEAGVPMRRQPLTTVQIDQAAQLYEIAGLSLSQICAELGIAQSSLQLAFTKRGVVLRPPTGGRRAS